MGDVVSINDSLVITVFSMIVVFVVLLVISYLINILKLVAGEKKAEKRINAEESVMNKPGNIEKPETTKEVEYDEEIVAAITAAIAASLQKPIPQINIRTIRRVYSSSPRWAEAGIREQVFEKL